MLLEVSVLQCAYLIADNKLAAGLKPAALFLLRFGDKLHGDRIYAVAGILGG